MEDAAATRYEPDLNAITLAASNKPQLGRICREITDVSRNNSQLHSAFTASEQQGNPGSQQSGLVRSLHSDQTTKKVKRKIKIGTCGFGLGQVEYARTFSCVEIQHTFYQPPRLTTLNRWRQQMPPEFEFTLKAWQLITHEAKSPTYRRLKRKLSETEKAEAGYFRATAIVNEAWVATLSSAKVLRAKTILFQCPSSFKQTAENIARMEKFFGSIDRQDLNLCWEPRGEWDAGVVRSICVSFELCHVVDPFVRETVTPDNYYFRLHGRNGWRYQYELAELTELATSIAESKRGYVFFNNSKMTEDALKFCQVLGDDGPAT